MASFIASRCATPGETLCPLRYKAATANTPLDEAFRMQLAVRRLNGIARNVQRLCKRTRGGQRLADVQRAVEDELPDAALDARIQRQSAMRGVTNPGFDGF